MKILVIYKSSSGFTRTYAEWIAQDLSADLYDIKRLDMRILPRYDAVIFGGSLHASGIFGLKKLKKHLIPEQTHFIVFGVGASPPKEDLAQKLIDANFSEYEKNHVRLFYLRGGFDFERLDAPHKLAMTLFKWMLKRTKNKTPDIEGMLAAYEQPADYTSKDNLTCLLEYARSL